MPIDLTNRFEAIKADWISESARSRTPGPVEGPPVPFVTIARQVGAGGTTLAEALIQRLNEARPGHAAAGEESPWRAFDRALVEKVAADNQLSRTMVERLEDVHRNWLRDLTAGLVGEDLAEARAFRQVAQTIVALARHGRAVIVGRGGVFLTRHLAGGVHIYLVAPFERRVRRMAQQWAVDDDTAATRVRQMEAARSSFYQRFFPARTLTPDVFHLTINTAKVPESLLVDLVNDVVAHAV